MGAWIEIIPTGTLLIGLKSHPTMGAWIEIEIKRYIRSKSKGRTPRWVRGLKLYILHISTELICRTPRWVRGLKLSKMLLRNLCQKSHPTMGAWIEILLADRRRSSR